MTFIRVISASPNIVSVAYALILFLAPEQLVYVIKPRVFDINFISLLYVSLYIYAISSVIIVAFLRKASLLDYAFQALPTIFVSVFLIRVDQRASYPLAFSILVIVILSIAKKYEMYTARLATFITVLFLWLTASVALLIADVTDPIAFARQIGPLLIVVIGLGQLSLGLFFAFSHSRAGPTALIVLIGSIIFTAPNDHDVPTLNSDMNKFEGNFSQVFRRWVRSRSDYKTYATAHRPYPVIFVASEGGGIYAAIHAYAALMRFQDQCPSFAQHVFAMVGVSGGSFGNLLFSDSVKNVRNSALRPCRPTNTSIDLTGIAADHLSPILARLLFVELPDFLLPGRFSYGDRGSILSQSMQQASIGSGSVFGKALRDSWDIHSGAPMLIFTATNVETGQRLVMSPVPPDSGYAETFPPQDDVSDLDIRTVDAASVSARFPWITPTARLHMGGEIYHVFADGGYFENSGEETVIDLVGTLKRAAADGQFDRQVRNHPEEGDLTNCVLFIESNFTINVRARGCDTHVFLSTYMITSQNYSQLGSTFYNGERDIGSGHFLEDPLSTMLHTRVARGQLAAKRALEQFCGEGTCPMDTWSVNMGFFENILPLDVLPLPLGWSISPTSAKSIASIVGNIGLCDQISKSWRSGTELLPANEELPNLTANASETAKENGCDAATMAYLFNPSLSKSSYSISER